ncbi:MAG: transcriptional repressor [Planctomycetes bacterium]|nr:transcriptional repressor [Planctomycetota bacterium]
MSYAFEKNVDHPPGDEIRIFEDYLRERGLKLTAGRRQLVDLVFRDHSHFTADGLFDRCRERGIRISKATLYRTLTILLDCKLLAAHDFGEGSRYYEHVYGHRHHDHLFCLVCKAIAEFHSERIEQLQDAAARELGFQPIRHSLAIFGVCDACQQTTRGRAVVAEAEAEA